MTQTIVTIITVLVQGVPKLIEAIKAGRNPGDIKLSEFISTDAVNAIDSAINTARAAEDRFPD